MKAHIFMLVRFFFYRPSIGTACEQLLLGTIHCVYHISFPDLWSGGGVSRTYFHLLYSFIYQEL